MRKQTLHSGGNMNSITIVYIIFSLHVYTHINEEIRASLESLNNSNSDDDDQRCL